MINWSICVQNSIILLCEGFFNAHKLHIYIILFTKKNETDKRHKGVSFENVFIMVWRVVVVGSSVLFEINEIQIEGWCVNKGWRQLNVQQVIIIIHVPTVILINPVFVIYSRPLTILYSIGRNVFGFVSKRYHVELIVKKKLFITMIVDKRQYYGHLLC